MCEYGMHVHMCVYVLSPPLHSLSIITTEHGFVVPKILDLFHLPPLPTSLFSLTLISPPTPNPPLPPGFGESDAVVHGYS